MICYSCHMRIASCCWMLAIIRQHVYSGSLSHQDIGGVIITGK